MIKINGKSLHEAKIYAGDFSKKAMSFYENAGSAYFMQDVDGTYYFGMDKESISEVGSFEDLNKLLEEYADIFEEDEEE